MTCGHPAMNSNPIGSTKITSVYAGFWNVARNSARPKSAGVYSGLTGRFPGLRPWPPPW